MSLSDCIIRWPSTTRWPWLLVGLLPRYGSRTDAWASFAWRNSGSSPSRPSMSTIQARVPTLPTPTTLRAMSTYRNRSRSRRRSLAKDRRYERMSSWMASRVIRRPALRDELIDRDDQRRVAGDLRLPVHEVGQLRERLEAVLRARLRDVPLHARDGGRRELRLDVAHEGLDVEAGVPDVQVAHRREALHREPVALHDLEVDRVPDLRVEAAVPAGNGEARDQPLDVPFERPRQRLVEVVDAEDHAAVRRRIGAEVHEMGVAAQLGVQAGPSAARQVGRHQGGRAAVERERRHEHPAVADGQEALLARHPLRLEDGDGVGARR